MSDKPAQRGTQPIPQGSRKDYKVVVHNYNASNWCRSCKEPRMEFQTSDVPRPLNYSSDGRDYQSDPAQSPSRNRTFAPPPPHHPYGELWYQRPRPIPGPVRQLSDRVSLPATDNVTPPAHRLPNSTPRPDEGFLAKYYNLQPDDV